MTLNQNQNTNTEFVSQNHIKMMYYTSSCLYLSTNYIFGQQISIIVLIMLIIGNKC